VPQTEDERRARLAASFAAQLPREIDRVTWPLAQLWALRDQRLRELIRHAKDHSPWHAKRLKHIDPTTVSGDDLSAIPPMTKADLMDNWNEIITDRRLTLELTTAHLERSVTEGRPSLLLDQYVVLATGGSSGHRAVIVWLGERFVESITPSVAHGWRSLARGAPLREPARATVMASSPLHGTAAIYWIMKRDDTSIPVFPPSLPLAEIVNGLNRVQPTELIIYPSMLRLLVEEVEAGRLRIKPDYIGCGGEPLLPEIRLAAESAFGVGIKNVYGLSEMGAIASSNPPLAGLHLLEHVGVYEPVDRDLRPVPPGVRATSLLVTSVLGLTLPIIRYQVTDEVTFLAEPNAGPWSGRRIADIEGRVDEVFKYSNGSVVHPHVIRSTLAQVSAIVEYQVLQTANGVDVLLRTSEEIDGPALAAKLTTVLGRLGLRNATPAITLVDRIERHPQSGKIKRFVPLKN
jgi:phenylacetate-coenzyme A ligase PaaK-like adenylate-forming protein